MMEVRVIESSEMLEVKGRLSTGSLLSARSEEQVHADMSSSLSLPASKISSIVTFYLQVRTENTM